SGIERPVRRVGGRQSVFPGWRLPLHAPPRLSAKMAVSDGRFSLGDKLPIIGVVVTLLATGAFRADSSRLRCRAEAGMAVGPLAANLSKKRHQACHNFITGSISDMIFFSSHHL